MTLEMRRIRILLRALQQIDSNRNNDGLVGGGHYDEDGSQRIYFDDCFCHGCVAHRALRRYHDAK